MCLSLLALWNLHQYLLIPDIPEGCIRMLILAVLAKMGGDIGMCLEMKEWDEHRHGRYDSGDL